MMTIEKEKNNQKQQHIHFLEVNQFKTNIISIGFRVPLTRENATKTALLAEVLKNGCCAYPSRRAVSQKTDDMFGSVFDISIIKKGEEQVLFFYLEFVKYKRELMEECFVFLQNMIFAPIQQQKGFSKQIVEREKRILEEKIKSRQDDKKEYAKLRCLEEMCKGEAFGIFADGYIEDLSQIDENILFHHYQNIIKHTPTEIFLTGEKTQKEAMLDFAKRMPFESDCAWKTEKKVNQQQKEVKQIKETLHTAQSRIALGFWTKIQPESKEYATLLVCNELFGGSPASLLFQQVREKEGACYDISSFLFRLQPILMVKAGIQKQDYDKAVEMIQKALKMLQQKKVEKEPLQEAKENIVRYYEAMKDSQTALMDFVWNEKVLKTNRNISQFVAEIKAVTAEAVQKSAQGIFLDTVYFLQ